MNPRQLSRPDVVEFARNAIKALQDGKITGLSPAEAAELAATLSSATNKLATSDQKVVATRSAYREATEDASVDEANVIGILTGLKFRMRGTGAGPDEYKAAGFDPPARSKRVEPEKPTNLSATGFSNGVNRLKFSGNNAAGTVIYTVQARPSLTAEWVIIGSNNKQTFKHTPVAPGQFYQYRVRADATNGLTSDWSNETVVYPPE